MRIARRPAVSRHVDRWRLLDVLHLLAKDYCNVLFVIASAARHRVPATDLATAEDLCGRLFAANSAIKEWLKKAREPRTAVQSPSPQEGRQLE